MIPGDQYTGKPITNEDFVTGVKVYYARLKMQLGFQEKFVLFIQGGYSIDFASTAKTIIFAPKMSSKKKIIKN